MNSIVGRSPSDGEIGDWQAYVERSKPSTVSGRRPTPSERELWENYTAGRPIAPPEKTPASPNRPEKSRGRTQTPVAARAKLKPFEIGSKATPRDRVIHLSDEKDVIQLRNYQLDEKIKKRLTAGKIRPEDSLDLHGMDREKAEKAVANFVLSSFRSGKRLVLIVTGKGRTKYDIGPIPHRTGILRRSMQAWLDAPPLNNIVQYAGAANEVHGGSGAFYVYLRRQQKAQ